ncbi:thioredoxin family protein [uncultured Clostridium sp.]|uniref:thioredoxin family protein n=1 Tax=uncultured Clostridium sp. TaxID=59620 RepID=UPI0028E97119|nr:thioredoxin family protein [uncultured Clostridium sp.]
MNNKNAMKSKNIAIKIIVPVLLLFIVVGIWFVKNHKKTIDSVESNNADFALHVTKEIDLEKLKSYGLPIIIDFGADSCIPCKEMAPVLKELNKELQGKAIIKFVDVWKYQALAEGYPISVIPTQIFIDAKGKPYNPKDPEAKQMKVYSLRDTGEHVFTVHEGGMTKEQMLNILKEMGLK